jgi:uroporphyrinogen-III synthase
MHGVSASKSAEHSPLQSKRVLVTRTREQASHLSKLLQASGAIPVEFPTIRIVPPQDWSLLDTALKRLYFSEQEHQQAASRPYDWLVFTSANGVHICLERLISLGYDPRALKNVRVATIGPATAAALATYGITADLVPGEYIAESVAAALIDDARQRGTTIAGQHLLLARAAEARKVLVTELQAAGAIVDEVAAYYTLAVAGDDERGQEIVRLLRERQLDILTFTSSSTVRNFVSWLKDCTQATPASSGDLASLLDQLTIASIGPITSQTARDLGLHVDVEARKFTIDGLVEALIQATHPSV